MEGLLPVVWEAIMDYLTKAKRNPGEEEPLFTATQIYMEQLEPEHQEHWEAMARDLGITTK